MSPEMRGTSSVSSTGIVDFGVWKRNKKHDGFRQVRILFADSKQRTRCVITPDQVKYELQDRRNAETQKKMQKSDMESGGNDQKSRKGCKS